MTHYLSKRMLASLPEPIIRPVIIDSSDPAQLVHIGIGAFHRSHQAYVLAKLLALNPEQYWKWRIVGVGLMPHDKPLVDAFSKQDNLYILRTVAADDVEEIRVIPSITEMLHAQDDTAAIIERIATKHTQVISFTITEGGYNFDYEKHRFILEQPAIQQDLLRTNRPKTVFGFLARGLDLRRSYGNGQLTLLSCDNIISNGNILKTGLLSFLEAYDPSLKAWADQHLYFPNSMVDRITPVPNERDKVEFEKQFGVRDNCLVLAEDYFQWVIEKGVQDRGFPPLDLVGVTYVDDVAVYERMKLGILNAGHSLVGLLGDALGYQTIHEAVLDPDIALAFEHYCKQEVIPVLAPIPGLSYEDYFERVRHRFSNAMINDSTARIISGTSDKFPKFVLPIIQAQLSSQHPRVQYAALIVGAWWYYLHREMQKNAMEDVNDSAKERFIPLFLNEDRSVYAFISDTAIFDHLKDNTAFMVAYTEVTDHFKTGTIRNYLRKINTIK